MKCCWGPRAERGAALCVMGPARPGLEVEHGAFIRYFLYCGLGSGLRGAGPVRLECGPGGKGQVTGVACARLNPNIYYVPMSMCVSRHKAMQPAPGLGVRSIDHSIPSKLKSKVCVACNCKRACISCIFPNMPCSLSRHPAAPRPDQPPSACTSRSSAPSPQAHLRLRRPASPTAHAHLLPPPATKARLHLR